MAKNAYIGVSNVARKVSQPYIGVNNVARKIKGGYIGVNGVAREFFTGGKALSSISEGTIVKLMEYGVAKEFYVVKHDYESGLNGSGRTLLLRRYVAGTNDWNVNVKHNAYSGSTIDSLLNNGYLLNAFDANTKSAIGTTTFYYVVGNKDTTVSTLSRSVFLLSAAELGFTVATADAGTALPNATNYHNAYNESGSITSSWTRSPRVNTSDKVYTERAGNLYNYEVDRSQGFRPAFTLPAAAKFNPDTLEFISV